MLSIELHCLSTSIPLDNIDEFSKLLQDSPSKDIILLLLQRKYESCLQLCKKELNFDSIKDLHAFLQSFCNDNSNTEKREILLFCCGVSCLQLFVQRNWLGPFITTDHPWQNNRSDELEKCAFNILQQDGNTVPNICELLPYLVIAEGIFELLAENTFFETANWWLLRCYSVHSHILNEHSEALFKKSTSLIERCLLPTFINDTENKSYRLQLNLEIGILLLYNFQYKQADTHFEQANMLSGVTFELTGAMGVRTKFQQKPVAQLLVEVERKDDKFPSKVTVDHANVPKDLALNDDTLLEKIKFSEVKKTLQDLSPEELSTIIARCTYMQKTRSSHKLQHEEIGALIQYLLSCKSCWSIQNEALRIRSNIENQRSRLVERCMMQMELLVNLVKKKDENAQQRLDLFYSIFSPPIWEMEKELAKLFTSLGATSAAMDIYKRLEMWEDAIWCLIQSNRADEARNMLEYQLKNNETPNLWCLMGDLQREPKHYTKAWELSNHRSARAMKSLGAYHISKRQFEEAVECFDKSLAILSLQTGTWFTLGCSCLALEKFERAAHAFRRCVGLNWDNFEAWSNLASSYIKCGKKNEAFKALTEAIKCNFNKWQLWENYLVVSIDVGHFNEAITAYTRLLDIKQRFVDVEILQTLVRVVVEDIPSAIGQPGSTLKAKLLKLFGHVTSKVTNEYEIWELYGKLCGKGLGENEMENTKALQHLHKALRVGLQKSGWEKNEETIKKFVEISDDLEKGCEHCVEVVDLQTLSSIRLTLKGFSVKLKQREKLMLEVSAEESMATFVKKVEGSADQLQQFVDKKKST